MILKFKEPECTRLKPGPMVCSCDECYTRRWEATLKVFANMVEDGPETNWDYDWCGSRQNFEWGE